MKNTTAETKKADLAMLTVALIWAFNTPAMKIIYGNINPKVYTGIRFILISIMSAAVFYFLRKERDLFRFKSKHDVFMVLSAAFFAFFCYQVFIMEGLNRTNVFFATVLICLSPIFAAIFSSIFKIETITPKLWLGLLISLGGIVVFKMNGLSLAYEGDLIGELFCVGSAMSWAAFTVMSKSAAYQSYSTSKVNAITAMFGTVLLLIYVTPDLSAYPISTIDLNTWLLILFTVIFPIVIAYQLYNFGVRTLGVERTIIYVYLVPVLVGIIAIPLGLESFSMNKFVGALVVIGGMMIARKA